MNKQISFDDFSLALDDAFSMGKDFSFAPTGTSMLPTINGTTDVVVLTKKPQQLNKLDVVMYRRANGSLVLHRITDIAPDGSFTMSGDNHYYYEYGITYDDILAVMTSFQHNGKTVSVTDFVYRVRSRIILCKKKTYIFLSQAYHKFFH